MNRCVIFLSIVVDRSVPRKRGNGKAGRRGERRVVVAGQEVNILTRARGGCIVSVGEFLIVPLFPALSAISGGIKQKQIFP